MALLPQTAGKENSLVCHPEKKSQIAQMKPQAKSPLLEKNLLSQCKPNKPQTALIKTLPEKTMPSSDDDFIPMKKKPKITPNDVKCMFVQSTIRTVHSTFS